MVRTKNWAKALERDGAAGQFKLSVNGIKNETILGNGNPEWSWQKAGKAKLKKGTNTLSLHDQTGFNGRVDAILFSNKK